MFDKPPYWFLISDPFHTLFYRATATMSVLSNIVLIAIITTNSSMRTENYRYLLLCFAVGDVISSLSHAWISPIIHLTEHGFFFFPKDVNELKSEGAILGKIAVLFYTFTYFETFNLLAFHFIYRYIVIVQGKLQFWTSNWRFAHWITAAIIFMIAHTTLMVGAMWYSNTTSEYTLSLDSSEFIHYYGVDTSDPSVGYIAVEYRRLNATTGVESYDISTMVSFIIIMSGFGISGITMILCSFSILEALKSMQVSTAQKVQQRMLFRALLVQALLPCIFAYLPNFIIWFWPLITGVALGPFGNLLIIGTVVFPSIDAMMIIYFIPAYRQAFVKYVIKKWQPNEMKDVHVTAFTASTAASSVRHTTGNGKML